MAPDTDSTTLACARDSAGATPPLTGPPPQDKGRHRMRDGWTPGTGPDVMSWLLEQCDTTDLAHLAALRGRAAPVVTQRPVSKRSPRRTRPSGAQMPADVPPISAAVQEVLCRSVLHSRP